VQKAGGHIDVGALSEMGSEKVDPELDAIAKQFLTT